MADVGFWEGLRDVATGRGQFRLVLQPLVAILLGVRFGISDAKAGNEPFVSRVLVTSGHRAALLKQALNNILIPFTVAVVLDGVLQYLTLGRVRISAAIVMGLLLIAAPFLISRSFANRLYRRTHPKRPAVA
ncbi:MAG TPA: hypothetical protein VL326_13735 [Kofleriaceae bacterium]|jgi:hypothetical protein|nr:hypothetical protein [Kofleriaceae bacterium]